MEYAEFGSTGLQVSRICLGTGFRSIWDDQVALAALEAAAERGCNFLNTANIYKDGWSEGVVGRFLKGRRDRFILTTKVGGTVKGGGPGTPGVLRREPIMRGIEESLGRLAHLFDFDHADGRDPGTYTAPLVERLQYWRDNHCPGALTSVSNDRALVIHDRRPGARQARWEPASRRNASGRLRRCSMAWDRQIISHPSVRFGTTRVRVGRYVGTIPCRR